MISQICHSRPQPSGCRLLRAGLWLCMVCPTVIAQDQTATSQQPEESVSTPPAAMADQTPPPRRKPNQCHIAPPYKFNLEDCGRIIFTHKPLHPLMPASFVPGSGPAIGAALEFRPNRDVWQIHSTTAGGVTFRKFLYLETKVNFAHQPWSSTAQDDFRISLYARYREMPGLSFYGLGPDSRKQDRTLYFQRDTQLGVSVLNPINSWLAVGGQVESIWPTVIGVRGKPESIEKRFTEVQAPGLTRQPHLMRYGFYLNPHHPAEPLFDLDYRIGYDFYQDTNDGRFSFRRLEVDVRHAIRFGRIVNDPYTQPGRAARMPHSRRSNLLLRGRLASSITGRGREVPFYMQQTLGGSDINSDTGLRGFGDYRFRDRNLALFQTEYQFEIKNGYGLLVFYETGKVAPRFDDLGSARLRHSYGLGFTISRGDRLYFRVYVGLGGGEGAHTFFGVPKFF